MRKEKFSYCFVCVSPYQHLVSSIYAKELYDRLKKKSIIIDKYFSVPYFANDEYNKIISIRRNKMGKIFSVVAANTPFLYLSEIGKSINDIECLIYFNDRDPLTQRLYNEIQCRGGKLILIEEGIGTYFVANKTQNLTGTVCQPDIAIVGYPDIYKKFHKSDTYIVPLDYKSLFSKEHIEPYMQVIDNNISCDVLFLGQAVQEKIREKECELLEWINRTHPDLRVVLKPHPRDYNISCYGNIVSNNISILNKSMLAYPIETLAYNMDIDIIITLNSSGGITLANMFPNLSVIFTFEITKLNYISNKNLKEIAQFIPNLYIPETHKEFHNLLKYSSVNPRIVKTNFAKLELSPFC